MSRVPSVSTKFLPPRLAGPILRRSRLLDALHRHLDHKLLLLSADAGYGKTTLMAEFIREAGIPCAWYRLEHADRDPAVFLARLLEAVRLHFPGFGRRLHRHVQAGAFRREAAVAHLVNDLGRLPGLLVALDDYHLVDESQEINLLLDALLDHLPPATHFIVSTRTAPRLSLSRLRAQNGLFEIGTDGLRFTPQEIEALFATLGVPLDRDTFHTLAERAEGWVLALLLAYHSVREKDTEEGRAFLRGLRGSARYIYDYLNVEVFETQPPSVRSFLRATSILPRLSPEICNPLLQVTTAGETLHYLEQHNLFTHCFDDERGWYRYHPLFADFLQARLLKDEGPARTLDLHRRAAVVLEEMGFPQEAFEQHGHAGDWEEAGRLVEGLGGRLLETGRLQTLGHLLGQLPPAVIEASPRLLLTWGRLLELQGRWTEARGRFERARSLFATRGDAGGMLQALMGVALTHFRQGHYPTTLDLCREALTLAPRGDPRDRAEVLWLLGGCHLETDDLDQGARYLEAALEAYRGLGHRRAEARVLHGLAYSVRFVRGDFLAALRMEEEAARICEALGDSPTLGFCLIGLGHVLLVLGRHQEAMLTVERLLRLCDEWGDEPKRGYALFIMADACRELGDRSRARALYAEALTLGERLEEPTVRLHALLGLARLLSWDDPGGAQALAGRALAVATQLGFEWYRGRSLMVLGAIAGREQQQDAVKHLLEAIHIFEHLQARYDLARAHLLLASLLPGEARGVHLEDALSLGERGAYHALFLHTERETALPLLVEALGGRVRPDYAGQLLLEASAGAELLSLLDHPHAPVRVHAARLLGEMGDVQVRGRLRRLLRDRDGEVRKAVETALEQLGHRPPPPLRVCFLGPFRAFRGQDPIPDVAWKRSTAKVLFQHLVGQRRRMMPEEAILEALWPGMAPESAHATFHAALHVLRKALEPDLADARDSAYVVSRRDLYGFNPSVEFWVDAEEFDRLARAGKTHEQAGDAEEAIHAFRDADRVYAGDYLEENPYQEWSAPERERLRQMEIEVLLRLGELLAERDPPAAIDAFRRAMTKEPYSEIACRGLMRLLAQTGHRAEALQQYQILERTLQQDLQVTPSPETTGLYRWLLVREP